nr:hypothetical protein [Tanacetum cinerariifolium]
ATAGAGGGTGSEAAEAAGAGFAAAAGSGEGTGFAAVAAASAAGAAGTAGTAAGAGAGTTGAEAGSGSGTRAAALSAPDAADAGLAATARALAGKQAAQFRQQARHRCVIRRACEGKAQRKRVGAPRLVVGMVNEHFDVFALGKRQSVRGRMDVRADGEPQEGQRQLFTQVFHQISNRAAGGLCSELVFHRLGIDGIKIYALLGGAGSVEVVQIGGAVGRRLFGSIGGNHDRLGRHGFHQWGVHVAYGHAAAADHDPVVVGAAQRREGRARRQALDRYLARLGLGTYRGNLCGAAAVIGLPAAGLPVLVSAEHLLGLDGERRTVSLIHLRADGFTQQCAAEAADQHRCGSPAARANAAADQHTSGAANDRADVFLVSPVGTRLLWRKREICRDGSAHRCDQAAFIPEEVRGLHTNSKRVTTSFMAVRRSAASALGRGLQRKPVPKIDHRPRHRCRNNARGPVELSTSPLALQLRQFLHDARCRLLAHQLLAHLALVVNDVGHREGFAFGEVVMLGGVLGQHSECDAECLAGALEVFTLQVVEIDTEDADVLIFQLLGQPVQFGDFRPARAAP